MPARHFSSISHYFWAVGRGDAGANTEKCRPNCQRSGCHTLMYIIIINNNIVIYCMPTSACDVSPSRYLSLSLSSFSICTHHAFVCAHAIHKFTGCISGPWLAFISYLSINRRHCVCVRTMYTSTWFDWKQYFNRIKCASVFSSHYCMGTAIIECKLMTILCACVHAYAAAAVICAVADGNNDNNDNGNDDIILVRKYQLMSYFCVYSWVIKCSLYFIWNENNVNSNTGLLY